jgi:beta-phosphoglucomutase-like phosphatase (HAD superfamily)
MKAIIFDMDGVLVDTMPFHYEAMKTALIVENAPLGVQAANNAGIKCVVVLNSSPLSILDFKGIIKDDKSIFKDIKSAGGAIMDWCEVLEGELYLVS